MTSPRVGLAQSLSEGTVFTLASFWNISAIVACKPRASVPRMCEPTSELPYESARGEDPDSLEASGAGAEPPDGRYTVSFALWKANGRRLPLFLLPACASGTIWRRPVTANRLSDSVFVWPNSFLLISINGVCHRAQPVLGRLLTLFGRG